MAEQLFWHRLTHSGCCVSQKPTNEEGVTREPDSANVNRPGASLARSDRAAKREDTGRGATQTEEYVAAEVVPVVGIGASAGGIEALIRFFEAMPSESGMAFLVVMHLNPSRDSGLAHILGQHTAMPVAEATDGVAIKPDHVYVIAPDSLLTVDGGRLRLTEPPERRGQRYPIDRLFESLAKHRLQRAICIVLSGTGSDGTEGLKEVKEQGGCVLVQDPATARFEGMPRSAIAAKLPDQVLAPEQMPAVLLRYMRHAYVAGPEVADETISDAPSIDPVLGLLRARTSQDFRNYKRSTVMRRIHRRMGLNDIEGLAPYVEFLSGSPAEIDILVKDLMISVTGLFRDPQALAGSRRDRPRTVGRRARQPLPSAPLGSSLRHR